MPNSLQNQLIEFWNLTLVKSRRFLLNYYLLGISLPLKYLMNQLLLSLFNKTSLKRWKSQRNILLHQILIMLKNKNYKKSGILNHISKTNCSQSKINTPRYHFWQAYLIGKTFLQLQLNRDSLLVRVIKRKFLYFWVLLPKIDTLTLTRIWKKCLLEMRKRKTGH